MDAFIVALKYPGIKQLTLRSTYEELEKSVLREVETLYPASIFKYNKSSHTGKIGDSILDFGYLASDKDLMRYQSAEYDIIRFDELTHQTEYRYTYMMSRVRGNNNFPKQIKSSTNPGSRGHAWVKKRFITAAEPNTTFTVNGMSRRFIPAKVYDNLFLMKSNPEYIEWLMQLPEAQREALLNGNWDIFEGQYFTEYSYDTHVVPREKLIIPKDWRRFRSMDWGFKDPCCVLWFTIAPSGRIFVYDELYMRFVPDKLIAEKIREKTKNDPIAYTVASPDMFKEDGKSAIDGPTLAEIFANNGVPLLRADNSRVPGWQRVRDYLAPIAAAFSTVFAPLSHASRHAAGQLDALSPSNIGAAKKSSGWVAYTILAAGWSGSNYTITSVSLSILAGVVDAATSVEIQPGIGITAAQLNALQAANLQEYAQSAGSITLKAYGTVPAIDVPIRVNVRGDVY
ncbi:MAG: hypothetical protein GX417_07175 [Clostridiales bacterium]|nr:hypothetical protein [Clostridiales bacterium]